MTDEHQPVDQGAGPLNGHGEDQTKVGTEDNMSQNERVRVPRGRVVAVILLLVGAIGTLLRLFLDRPDSIGGTAALVVIASALLGAFSFFLIKLLPVDAYRPLAAVVGVAVTSGTLIATLVTVPADSRPTPSSSTSSSTAQSASPSPSPTPSEPPLTATLQFGEECEGFALPNPLLKSLPKPKEITAKWAYEHGGATLNNVAFVLLQGTSEDAVILKGMRVIDLERAAAPPNYSDVLPCSASGGFIRSRYFDIKLAESPKIRPKADKDSKAPQPKFPFKVSNSDPEYFELWVYGPPCVCSWRLALDWTSRGRSGTLVVDRGFSKILSNTMKDLQAYQYSEGRWDPPLPK